MSQFKVGDRVKVVENYFKFDKIDIGEIGVVDKLVNRSTDGVYVQFERTNRYMYDKELELIKEDTTMFKKSDLKVGMLLVRRDGSKRIIYQTKSGNLFAALDEGSNGGWIEIRDYNEDLKNNSTFGNPNLDIMKVYDLPSEGTRNISCEDERNVLWERIEPVVKEMTVEDISKALGYDVKVVK